MATLKQNAKNCGPNRGKSFNISHSNKKKRKWAPNNKFLEGSLKEGQGFAFKRKEKIKHEYNKILRKERKKPQISGVKLEEEYPEHLRHLYLAEREQLDKEEQEKKKKRSQGRAVDEEAEDDEEQNMRSDSLEKHVVSALTGSSNEPAQSHSSQKAQFTKKKQKMSSYQKTKKEYERIKEERAQKRQEFLKDKSQREEALRKYKEKKMATYQLLKKKTKKGQPNLNLQMELLLEKIQAKHK